MRNAVSLGGDCDTLTCIAAGIAEAFYGVPEEYAEETLAEYYESPLWRKDFEADEAGLLPAGLKRGVLSEDGIYNLLQS